MCYDNNNGDPQDTIWLHSEGCFIKFFTPRGVCHWKYTKE